MTQAIYVNNDTVEKFTLDIYRHPNSRGVFFTVQDFKKSDLSKQAKLVKRVYAVQKPLAELQEYIIEYSQDFADSDAPDWLLEMIEIADLAKSKNLDTVWHCSADFGSDDLSEWCLSLAEAEVVLFSEGV